MDAHFDLPKNYVFPSDKKLSKYPVVAIAGDANDYVYWLGEHKEIDKRVPPIFPDFIVTHSRAEKGGAANYEIFIHYDADFTKFYFRLRLNGEKLSQGMVDYNDINLGVKGSMTLKALEKYEEYWLKNITLASGLIVMAVQAYMLYFRPEIVEKIYTPSEPQKPRKQSDRPRRRITAEPIKIRKQKIKRIYLSAVDRPPKNINYKKLSWYVRGHYRHVGKDKKLKYIQPFTCNRGGKKYRQDVRKYLVPELKEPENQERNNDRTQDE